MSGAEKSGLMDADIYRAPAFRICWGVAGPNNRPEIVEQQGARRADDPSYSANRCAGGSRSCRSVSLVGADENRWIVRGPILHRTIPAVLAGDRVGRARLSDHRLATGNGRYCPHALAARGTGRGGWWSVRRSNWHYSMPSRRSTCSAR